MIFTIESLKDIFFFLERCKDTKQNIKYHPEGNVLNHSLQCFNCACRESQDTDLVLASLLHDIGKYENSYGHEEITIEWLKDICSVKTLFLIKHHMRIYTYLNGEMRKLSSCKYLANHPWLPELIQLTRFDVKARNPNIKLVLDKEMIVNKLNKIVDIYFKENHNYINFLIENKKAVPYENNKNRIL